jgi:hypothetical protein
MDQVGERLSECSKKSAPKQFARQNILRAKIICAKKLLRAKIICTKTIFAPKQFSRQKPRGVRFSFGLADLKQYQ